MIINLRVQSNRDYSSDLIFSYLPNLIIKGVVKEVNIPIPCRVRLYERLSGRFLAETVTDNLGNYSFNHLTANKFFVVAHHPLNTYNAVIADLVVPK